MIGPARVDLESGKEYFFCTCKRGDKGVFCNGAHKGTDYKPQKFSVDKSRNYQLCGCHRSSRLPFCDGSHSD